MITDEEKRFSDFLLKDYELKVRYLTDHFQRMWTRFNYFVTIESALVGGKFLIPSGVLSRELAIAGAILSFLWYVMGAEDRFLVRLYRMQVSQAAEKILALVPTEKAALIENYHHVGRLGCVAKTLGGARWA
jgi:hypothetical protein